MLTTIHVTQDHIDRGVAGKCRTCPVALALFEQTNKPYRVGTHVIYLFDGDDPKNDRIVPKEVTEFIRAFDARGRKSVMPFSFEIDL